MSDNQANNTNITQYETKMAEIMQFMNNAQFIEAERELLKIKQEADADTDAPNELRSDICYKLYHIAWINHDKTNAFKYAENAIAFLSNNDAKVQVYGNLAMNSLQSNQLEDADKFIENGLNLITEMTPTSWYLYLIRGKIHLRKGNLDAALDDFTHSASEANRLHMPHGEIAATICVADVLFRKGLANSALMEIIRMENYARKTMQMQQYLRVMIKKAQLLYQMGRDEDVKQVILTIPDFND